MIRALRKTGNVPLVIPPPTEENQKVLDAAKLWFEDYLENHYRLTLEASDPTIYNSNPFLVWHLAKTIDGEVTPRSIAKALIIPRQLGTSPTTSFGSRMQKFISDTLVNAYGSAASGMDIEFTDQIDGLEKFTQIKAGPLTINSDDVAPMDQKFKDLRNLLRTNGRSLPNNHFAVGVLYGEEKDLNAFYLKLRDDHGWELYVGRQF